MEADLATWYDSATSIGWTNALDRDQWFADLSTQLSGISLMAYERESLSFISNGVIWEVNHFSGDVRIGLNAKIGIDGEWPDFETFTNRLSQVDAAFHTTAAGTSVLSFSWFESAVPISPGRISLSDAAGEVVLSITNLTVGKTYALEQRDSLSMGSWQQIEFSINWDGNWSLTNYPGTQRFYRIHGQ